MSGNECFVCDGYGIRTYVVERSYEIEDFHVSGNAWFSYGMGIYVFRQFLVSFYLRLGAWW